MEAGLAEAPDVCWSGATTTPVDVGAAREDEEAAEACRKEEEEDSRGEGDFPKHSALLMVKFNNMSPAGTSLMASYQYSGHSSASARADALCSAHHADAVLA